jgi:LPS export ABC transporter permease LptF
MWYNPAMLLARYLSVQLVGPFLFGLSFFSGVLLLDKFFDIVDLLINRGVSLAMSVRVFLLFFPSVLSLSIPMSLLLACLLVFGRLSEDHELTALRASGLSFAQILWPPLAWAVCLFAFLIPFNATWSPRSVSAFRSLYHEIAQQDPLVKIEPGQFTPLRDARIYARRVDRVRDTLSDVWVYRRINGRSQRVYARTGAARTDDGAFTLNLSDGQIERFSPDRPQDVVHIRFKQYTLQVPLGEPVDPRSRSWRELTSRELSEEIRRRRAENGPAGEVLAEYHLRIAVAFAPLALALLGISLGITMERGGRGVGFGAATGVLFGYYLLLTLGLSLADRQAMPAFPALWMANAATLLAGGILYYRRVLR